MNLPQEVIDIIYRFNVEHRVFMREVMDELLWETSSERKFHSHCMYHIQEELFRRVLCENCNECKPVMYFNLEYCS
jgi:hypothetical protein